jgi:glycosyltransferase involved in cell wall biosynthesis
MPFQKFSPLRNLHHDMRPWEGSISKKPWEYEITAVIPVIDTPESLSICIETLRLQTIRPYIIVIDTGSLDDNLSRILEMRDEDLEVHSLRFNATQHPSDCVSMAMDFAQSACRTEYMFATHSDVFLRKRDFLEYLMSMCGDEEDKFPVVGYEMSPRQHDDWRGMISHTASMYHLRTLDKIGFGWSMRRIASLYGLKDHSPSSDRPNWPDTEILGNYILRDNNIKTKIIGSEQNFQRNKDEYIDHCRSMSLGLLYSEFYYKSSSEWRSDAHEEAKQRIKKWKKEELERVSQ